MELVHLSNGSAVLCDTSRHPITVDAALFDELRQWFASCKRRGCNLHHPSIEAMQLAEYPSVLALQVAVYMMAANVPSPSSIPVMTRSGMLASQALPRSLHCQLYRMVLFAKLRQHPALRYEVLASLVFEQHCVAPEAASAPFDRQVNYRGYMVNDLRQKLCELDF